MSEAEADEGAGNIGEAVLEFALGNFVRPVCLALVGSGRWSADTPVTRFEVRLPHDGEVSIRLNDAQPAWSRAWAIRDVAAGGSIAPTDLATREVPEATARGTSFIKGTMEEDGWRLEFRFGGPAESRVNFLRLADEFLASAHDDLSAGRSRAAFASAFHAAENYAKAELLHYPLTAALIETSKKHSAVRSAYALWARLGNADQRFADVLNALDRDRGRATYLDGDWTTEGDLPKLLATLDEMRTWVTRVVEGRGPSSIRAASQRDIEAGTLVGPGDLGLHPHRP